MNLQHSHIKQIRALRLNPLQIGMFSSNSFQNHLLIDDIFLKLNELPNYITINGAGNKLGSDQYIKKLTLELGFNYREFHPVHLPPSTYSALPHFRYNKKYAPKNLFVRYYNLITESEKLIIFVQDLDQDKIVQGIIKKLKKGDFNVPFGIIT